MIWDSLILTHPESFAYPTSRSLCLSSLHIPNFQLVVFITKKNAGEPFSSKSSLHNFSDLVIYWRQPLFQKKNFHFQSVSLEKCPTQIFFSTKSCVESTAYQAVCLGDCQTIEAIPGSQTPSELKVKRVGVDAYKRWDGIWSFLSKPNLGEVYGCFRK